MSGLWEFISMRQDCSLITSSPHKDLLMSTWATAAASSELSDVRCLSRIPLLHWEYLHHPGSLLITQTTLSHCVCCWEMKTLMLQCNVEIILCQYIEDVEVCLYVPGKYMIVASLFCETFRCQCSGTLSLIYLNESIKMGGGAACVRANGRRRQSGGRQPGDGQTDARHRIAV